MSAIDHISERADPPARVVLEPDGARHFAIDVGGLLALPQIRNCGLAPAGRNAERDAPAGAAAVEPKNQPRLLRRSAMVERIDAERPMLADQPRRHLLGKIESRSPHQRTIAEHPEIAVGTGR